MNHDEDRIRIAEERQIRFKEQEKRDDYIIRDTRRFRLAVLGELRRLNGDTL